MTNKIRMENLKKTKSEYIKILKNRVISMKKSAFKHKI